MDALMNPAIAHFALTVALMPLGMRVRTLARRNPNQAATLAYWTAWAAASFLLGCWGVALGGWVWTLYGCFEFVMMMVSMGTALTLNDGRLPFVYKQVRS